MTTEHPKGPRELIGALSATDSTAALAAWGTLSKTWSDLQESVQQVAIGAALQSRQPWIASAARRFLMDRWEVWPESLRAAAVEALGNALDDPGLASSTWPFLPDHWIRLPSELAALLSPQRVRLGLDNKDVAADVWDFLTTQWGTLPVAVRAVVTGDKISAALADPDWRVIIAVWDFLNENWPRLQKRLQDAISLECVSAAVGNPITAGAVEEFVAEHASTLSPAFHEATRA